MLGLYTGDEFVKCFPYYYRDSNAKQKASSL